MFWKRYKELPEYDKIVKNIERGEEMIRQKQLSIKVIAEKCYDKKYYDELDFNNHVYSKFRSRFYSMEHDKYLIFASHKWGLGNWREVRMEIKKEESFEFDSYFKSRTEGELNKRMSSLLRVIKAEQDYEAKVKHYRDMEESGEMKEAGNGKTLNGHGRSAILEEAYDRESFAEEIDVDNLSENPESGSKPSSKETHIRKGVAPENGAKNKLAKDQQASNSSQLTKRKPQREEKAIDKKPSIDKTKQQTLGSFFGSN